ncbi:hypothetical protein [Bifidobacterium platyrrhinorum]|uniref:hypothetical protein n=1 Tax=Bifidobacterium platyrrhinorum TaxID=2661628 RepID=UPI001CDB594B|nr:hypothetical protein [Bifidobacterium platyrrhinorum]
MTRYCVNSDGKHAGGLNVCAGCTRRFREALGSIGVDTPALLLIAARQAGTGDTDRTGVRSRSAHAPLLIREQAWELYCETEQLIRLAALQCGCPPATRRTAGIPELVRGILKDDKPLLTAPDAREWWRDITDTARKVNRMVDPPVTRVAFGACPFCEHGVVWGEPRANMGECRTCGAQVNRTYVADRLLDRLAHSEKKGTPKQLSRECARAGIRLPAATIRTWIHQKRLTPDQYGHVTLSSIVPLLRRRAG